MDASSSSIARLSFSLGSLHKIISPSTPNLALCVPGPFPSSLSVSNPLILPPGSISTTNGSVPVYVSKEQSINRTVGEWGSEKEEKKKSEKEQKKIEEKGEKKRKKEEKMKMEMKSLGRTQSSGLLGGIREIKSQVIVGMKIKSPKEGEGGRLQGRPVTAVENSENMYHGANATWRPYTVTGAMQNESVKKDGDRRQVQPTSWKSASANNLQPWDSPEVLHYSNKFDMSNPLRKSSPQKQRLPSQNILPSLVTRKNSPTFLYKQSNVPLEKNRFNFNESRTGLMQSASHATLKSSAPYFVPEKNDHFLENPLETEAKMSVGDSANYFSSASTFLNSAFITEVDHLKSSPTHEMRASVSSLPSRARTESNCRGYKLPPTQIPVGDHVAEDVLIVDPEEADLKFENGKFIKKIFPRDVPRSRQESLFLKDWFDKKMELLEKQSNFTHVCDKNNFFYHSRKRSKAINEYELSEEESLVKMHQMTATFFSEITRQVNSSCKEQAAMMEIVWNEYVEPLFELAKKAPLAQTVQVAETKASRLLEATRSTLRFPVVPENVPREVVQLADSVFRDLKDLEEDTGRCVEMWKSGNEDKVNLVDRLQKGQLAVQSGIKKYVQLRSLIDKQTLYHSQVLLEEKQREKEIRRIMHAIELLKVNLDSDVTSALERFCLDLLMLCTARGYPTFVGIENKSSNISIFGCNGLILDAVNLLRRAAYVKVSEILSFCSQAQDCLRKVLEYENVHYLFTENAFKLCLPANIQASQLKDMQRQLGILSKPWEPKDEAVPKHLISERVSRVGIGNIKQSFSRRNASDLNGVEKIIDEKSTVSLYKPYAEALEAGKLISLSSTGNGKEAAFLQIIQSISSDLILPSELYPVGVYHAYSRFLSRRDSFFTDGVEWTFSFTLSFINLFLERQMQNYAECMILGSEMSSIHRGLFEFFLQIANSEDRACEKLVQFMVAVKRSNAEHPRIRLFTYLFGMTIEPIHQAIISFYLLVASQMYLVLGIKVFSKSKVKIDYESFKQVIFLLITDVTSKGTLPSYRPPSRRPNACYAIKQLIQEDATPQDRTFLSLQDPCKLMNVPLIRTIITKENERHEAQVVNTAEAINDTALNDSKTVVRKSFKTVLREETELLFDDTRLIESKILFVSPGHNSKTIDFDLIMFDVLEIFTKAITTEEEALQDYYGSYITDSKRFSLNQLSHVLHYAMPGAFSDADIVQIFTDVLSSSLALDIPSFVHLSQALRCTHRLPFDSSTLVEKGEEIALRKSVDFVVFERVIALFMPSISAKAHLHATLNPKTHFQVSERIDQIYSTLESKRNVPDAWIAFREVNELLECIKVPSHLYMSNEE